MKEKKNYKIVLGIIVYLCSFVVIFPLSTPFFFIIGELLYANDISSSTKEIIFYGNILFISILGSISLNMIFKELIFNKNNKLTWSIFVAHLFLIPFSTTF
ncbi:hypothetical protein [Gottfriedia acidiceleris]|uniref:Uncharacterized protein n=1 Tax=Gottfriedia acidiceleris TaxID=371036 RepID=A0ABY4JG81_9BACI|nr:hypothetical protein [Gottfriedia acidiceleris]UPM52842.1 hypothetical protein MY490_13490 [Gottfriedia acidiceleris]